MNWIPPSSPAEFQASHLHALQIFIKSNLNRLPDSKEDWNKVRNLAGFLLTGLTPFTAALHAPKQEPVSEQRPN